MLENHTYTPNYQFIGQKEKKLNKKIDVTGTTDT